MRLRTAICFVLYLSALPLFAADKTPDADGFITIFDGKSLDGWKKSTENPDSIQLKDGAIVANSGIDIWNPPSPTNANTSLSGRAN